MRLQDLKDLGSAPVKGYLLLYTRKAVVFESYSDINAVKAKISERWEKDDLLELHLFDHDKEYRCIATQSRRFPGGVIESVVDGDSGASVYEEKIRLQDNRQDTITVINYLGYDDRTGMAFVDNYRLAKEAR